MTHTFRTFAIWSLVFSALPSARSQTEGWEVYRSGTEVLSGCALLSVSDSLLTLRHEARILRVSVDSIDLLRNIHVTGFWTGAGYGALAGTVLGVVVGYAAYSEPEHQPDHLITINLGPSASAFGGGVVGFVVGGLIGGSIAASSSGSDDVGLAGRTHRQRVQILGSLIQRHGEL